MSALFLRTLLVVVITLLPALASAQVRKAAMVRGGFRHLVVLDESQVQGVISVRDILRSWIQRDAAIPA